MRTKTIEKLVVDLTVQSKIALAKILDGILTRVGDQEADRPVGVITLKGGGSPEVLNINVSDAAQSQVTLVNQKNNGMRHTNCTKRKNVRSRLKRRKLPLPNSKELTLYRSLEKSVLKTSPTSNVNLSCRTFPFPKQKRI